MRIDKINQLYVVKLDEEMDGRETLNSRVSEAAAELAVNTRQGCLKIGKCSLELIRGPISEEGGVSRVDLMLECDSDRSEEPLTGCTLAERPFQQMIPEVEVFINESVSSK